MKGWLLMVLALLQFGVWSASASANPSLTMHVVPKIVSNNEIQLNFSLRYNGDQRFEADLGTLPGVQSRYAVTLDADRFPDWDSQWAGSPCTSFREIITINEPSPGWRMISGGQQFFESIALSDLYTGVEGALGRCEIVINWSYKMYTKDKVRFPRMAGSVVIPLNMRPVVPPDVSVEGVTWKREELGTPRETTDLPEM